MILNETRPDYNLTTGRPSYLTIIIYRIILFGNDRIHTKASGG